MGINKNAYLRYQILDKCFSNQFKIYFIEDLLEQVNKALEDFNAAKSLIQIFCIVKIFCKILLNGSAD